MKIQGSNPYVNAYKSQQQKHVPKKAVQPKDQIKISTEAKKLQQTDIQLERSQYIAEIKQRVQSGQYEIDYEKTAQKMIDFWSKQI